MAYKTQKPQDRALWENDVYNPLLPKTSKQNLEDMEEVGYRVFQAEGITPEDIVDEKDAAKYRAWLKRNS